MNRKVKTRPDRYLDRQQALAYHASTNADGRLTLSQRLEIRAVDRALSDTGGGDSVLDAPCGTGRIDALLRRRFEKVFGVDSSASMLSVYQQEAEGRAGCCCDVFNLPFRDNEFDWSICHRYFHHLHTSEERASLLASLARVSRLGVIAYAWLDTRLVKRKSSMRASIPRGELEAAISASGLALKSVHRCAGPFSVKSIVVCIKR